MKKQIIGFLASVLLLVAARGQVSLSDFSSTTGISYSGSWSGQTTLASESSTSFLRLGGSATDAGSMEKFFATVPDFSTLTSISLTYRLESGNTVSALNFVLTDGDFNSASTSLGLSSIGTGWKTVTSAINFTGIDTSTLQSWALAGPNAVSSDGASFQISFDGLTATAVPEPSTYAAILGLATLGLVGFRRYRRR